MEKLDGQVFKRMVLQAAQHLANNQEKINALNVFPVPDGDTGTNMHLTFTSGANEVRASQEKTIGALATRLAKGLLMGARGNSGVILSQIFRGFSQAVETLPTLDTTDFAYALELGVETAYKAVMKPVEGTILTVAKDAAAKAQEEIAKGESDLIILMQKTLDEAKASLQRTPSLLPVLQEVGVVDSGGQGLVTIYEAFLAVLKGQTLDEVETAGPSMDELVRAEHHKAIQSLLSLDDIEYGYCTEFMIKLSPTAKNGDASFDEGTYREKLEHHGDSLLVVSDEELVKVHIHSEYPGDVMTFSQQYGELINIKIENMRDQYANIVNEEIVTERKTEKDSYAIVTVVAGDGLIELFKSLGASEVIQGGQTMNPSTEDLIKAIENVNAETVFILPNNSNIMMAANQAANVATGKVIVIPTKTIPQGMAALFAFNREGDIEENESLMNTARREIKSGQITYAVRDTVVNGVTIQKNDHLSIVEDQIVFASANHHEALETLLIKMIDDESELVTIFFGKNINKNDMMDVERLIEEQFPHVEFEIHEGNQPVYSYIVAVE